MAGDWGQYWVGYGGTCADRTPPAGYWCAPGAPRAISTPNHPVGMQLAEDQLPNLKRYDAAQVGAGAVVHAWRPGHWYTYVCQHSQYARSKQDTASQFVTTGLH